MVESKWERRIEDIILFYFIITKVLQFFGLLSVLEVVGIFPEMIDFIDIIVSFTGLGYVLYRVSLTDIFFGEKNKTIDLILLLSYFLLITNKFVEFCNMFVGEASCLSNASQHFLMPLFCFIADKSNAIMIEQIAFYMGSLSLLLLSIYITFKIHIIEPSILNALHEDNKTKKMTKFISTFIVVVGFYLIFFNLVMEWLTRVLDAPIIIIALFVYIFKIHNIGKSMDAEATLFKISDIVETITEKFVELFHSKRTIFLGISAMLVLHLISDLGGFVIPYNLGIESVYEFSDNLHKSFGEIFSEDRNILLDNATQIFALFGYVINSIGTIFLMLFPAFIWFIIYLNHTREKKEELNFPGVLIALFFASLIFMMFLPTYRIGSMYSEEGSIKNLLGVDIQTQSILTSGNTLSLYFIISGIVFFFVFLLTKIGIVKDILFFIMTLLSLGFFGIYIYYFFHSIFWFYLDTLNVLFSQYEFYLGIFYMVFLMITVMFYIGGYLSFVISTFKEEDYKQKE